MEKSIKIPKRPAPPVVAIKPDKKRQFELSDDDCKKLGSRGYSKAAWAEVCKRHSIDPDTIEQISEHNERAFLGFSKIYPREAVSAPRPLNTGGNSDAA